MLLTHPSAIGEYDRVWPNAGLSLSKCFGPISVLHAQVDDTIQSNDLFFEKTFGGTELEDGVK